MPFKGGRVESTVKYFLACDLPKIDSPDTLGVTPELARCSWKKVLKKKSLSRELLFVSLSSSKSNHRGFIEIIKGTGPCFACGTPILCLIPSSHLVP